MHKQLTLKDRERLETLYESGTSVLEIAEALGVHHSTIYNEVRRGDTGEMDENGRSGYSAKLAQTRLYELRRESRKRKKESVSIGGKYAQPCVKS